MKVFKWTLAGAGGLAVAAIIAVSALGGGVSQAEEPGGNGRAAAYEQALANQLGITVEALQAAQKAALDKVLSDAVASGAITPQQAAEIQQHPRKATLRKAAGHVRDLAAGLLGAAADTIGISSDELKQELKSGKTLAQVAQANGVTTDQLKAGIIDAVEAKLDAAVAANNLSQQEADRISAGLAQRIDALINHTGGFGGQKP